MAKSLPKCDSCQYFKRHWIVRTPAGFDHLTYRSTLSQEIKKQQQKIVKAHLRVMEAERHLWNMEHLSHPMYELHLKN